MAEIAIGDRLVGDEHPTLIIAEAGVNHQGDPVLARRLIDIAVAAGADAVKFQKRNVDRILTREGLDAPYVNDHSFGRTYGEHRRRLELSEDVYWDLKRYADSKRILFLASAWDEESADFLEKLDVAAFKIASADLTNHPLIEHVARKGRPVILSTGMATLAEVDAAVDIIRRQHDAVAVLQCTSTYPAAFCDLHLRVIPMYRERYRCVVGYSGHELGIAIPPVAVALGARIVERHFTIDRTLRGRDHAASLEPEGLRKLVRDIRHVEEAMGEPRKVLAPGEFEVRQRLAKSLVTAVAVAKGERIERAMLTTKGPGTGISPARIYEVVGRRAARDLPPDVILREEDLV
jgi:sialic acid synthase SpsE